MRVGQGDVMKIVAVAGSSGGHIFPALCFLEAAKNSGAADTLLVLPKRNILSTRASAGCPTAFISITSLRLGSANSIFSGLCNLVKGSLESAGILLKYHPDVVVGFGSIASVPLVLGAWFMRIPTLIHEQNVVPGRATKFLSFFVDAIAVSFQNTRGYLSHAGSRVRVTGNPIRQGLKKCSKKEALDFFGLRDSTFTILVMGGSQGSRRINHEFMRSVPGLARHGAFQVIHLTGEDDYLQVKKTYEDLHVTARAYRFLDSMQYAYCAADIVIARAGAATVNEIIFFTIPAILIPYPFARGHQLSNAKLLEDKSAAIVLVEALLRGAVLEDTLESLRNNPGLLEKMRRGFSGCMAQSSAAYTLYESARAIVEA